MSAHPILSRITCGDADSDPRGAAFDAACGLYWYAADYHDGQTSPLYEILSTLDYEPGPLEHGPEDDLAIAIYADLQSGDVDPAELAAEIRAILDTITEE